MLTKIQTKVNLATRLVLLVLLIGLARFSYVTVPILCVGSRASFARGLRLWKRHPRVPGYDYGTSVRHYTLRLRVLTLHKLLIQVAESSYDSTKSISLIARHSCVCFFFFFSLPFGTCVLSGRWTRRWTRHSSALLRRPDIFAYIIESDNISSTRYKLSPPS